jgi:hypothetical protein
MISQGRSAGLPAPQRFSLQFDGDGAMFEPALSHLVEWLLEIAPYSTAIFGRHQGLI